MTRFVKNVVQATEKVVKGAWNDWFWRLEVGFTVIVRWPAGGETGMGQKEQAIVVMARGCASIVV